MTLLKKFIGWAFERHIPSSGALGHSNADYEVCPDLLCRLAVWLEATFNPYAAWWDSDEEQCVRCGGALIPELPGMWCPHCDSMTTEELIAEDDNAGWLDG